MKKILFVGIEKSGAVSKILSNIIDIGFDDFEVSSFGFYDKTEHLLSNNKNKYFYKIPFFPFQFLIKVRRRIYKKIHKDYYLLSWKIAFKQLKKIYKKINPDVIVAASGHFCYMKAAYELAKRVNCKLVLMFFDPYQNNSLIINRKKAIKEASRWCDYADCIFYDLDGEIPIQNVDKGKLIPFYIPIFTSRDDYESNNSIVYGGMFYSNFRSPDSLIAMINECKELNVSFDIYTEDYYAKEISKKTNNFAHTHKLLPEDGFHIICDKCFAIVAIGNGKMNHTIPSKLLEAIGHKKPIIGINFIDLPPYLTKYPYFYIYHGPETILKICSLDGKLLKEYDIFYNYPERNPAILISKLIKVINGKRYEKD